MGKTPQGLKKYFDNTTANGGQPSNFLFTFPFPVDSTLSDNITTFKSTNGNIEFIVTRNISWVVDKSKEQFDSSMQTFQRSIDSIELFKDYKKEFVDTIIGGTHGIFATLENNSDTVPFKKNYSFYTTKDTLTYYIHAKFIGADSFLFEQTATRFYNSLEFKNDYYAALTEKAPDRNNRNIIGAIIGWTTLLSVLAYLGYSMAKRKTVI